MRARIFRHLFSFLCRAVFLFPLLPSVCDTYGHFDQRRQLPPHVHSSNELPRRCPDPRLDPLSLDVDFRLSDSDAPLGVDPSTPLTRSPAPFETPLKDCSCTFSRQCLVISLRNWGTLWFPIDSERFPVSTTCCCFCLTPSSHLSQPCLHLSSLSTLPRRRSSANRSPSLPSRRLQFSRSEVNTPSTALLSSSAPSSRTSSQTRTLADTSIWESQRT